ncbi:[protein-PII] uridylyltransferase [Kangiella sediminilitoris]|uniref:Bifunctional uridylyltransferase/uridylyl-removing enzyme n=1 Tax=Kangiella sediminilitoris TaxID=1144748 RepID=A0A1B3BCA6_9GAMM|nr:[protein-PII] uridylyltransferase [Kangiella sediminilitoris]AOE50383.1 Bifunctional uridylyltransferase/uridylyl-removing enzyme [Kangiella sediminilitoris]
MASPDKFNYLPKAAELVKKSQSADGLDRLKIYKNYLQAGLDALTKQFQKGTSIIQLLRARSALIDHILATSWSQFSVHSHSALIAVGGYGREELQPYSDIDILVLLNDDSEEAEDSNLELEAWLAFLWDIGLEVGHSVRTINHCEQLALEDISVATNLIESRFICGNRKLLKGLNERIKQPDFWPSEAFFKAKLDEQVARHLKFKETSFNLEPNIKSNPGGLRDLQVIQWITLKHFKTSSLHDLIKYGIFTRREYRSLLNGQQFLHRVRFALHVLTGKREDRLLFEHQKKVAEWLGFEDHDNKLAVEHLMQRYYRAVMVIRNLNELFLQIFEQEYLKLGKSAQIIDLDQDFYLHNQRIGIKTPDLFLRKPHALIKIFRHIALNPEIIQIEAKTMRKIRSSQQMVNRHYRRDAINISYFKEFLSTKQLTSRGFALMKRTNILGAMIPKFAQIEGQMQFDLFHAYTVDEHTLFLLRYIIRYNKSEYGHEFPLCRKIMKTLVDPTPLYLAAIFHDIGKGRGGDHSELGAVDALEYCHSIGLDQHISELVSWLVRNHLIMSLVAQRKDISDPDVIESFASKIPSILHLELLYVLTVSDIRATNPTLWNSWKESLLKELFLATKHYLTQSTPRANQNQMMEDTRQQVLEQFTKTGESIEPVRELLSELGNDYLLRYHPEQIIWQTEQLLSQPELPYVAIKNHRSQAGTEVFIAVEDQPDLFASITALLSQNHLNIQAATLFTSPKGLCLDTFIVLDEQGHPLSYEQRIQEIQDNLIDGLSDMDNSAISVSRAVPTRLKYFTVKTNVEFINDDNSPFTTLEITALDRPALLANIGQAFRDCDIEVHSAKIVTLGERVEDTFTVSDRNHQPIIDKNRIEKIKEHLGQAINA